MNAIELLHKPEGLATVDVVFIHGIWGDSRSTWTTPSKELWPLWLRDSHSDAMVWSLSFDSSVTAWSGRSAGAIVDIACDLIERMRVNGVGNRTLVFIAHSMGGLIVKQILRVAEYAPLHVNLIENLRGIIFFATPHFGSDLSSLARTLRWLLLPTVGLLDMVANDPHLIELNAWFRSFATRLRIRVLALIETQPVARSKWLPFLSVSVVPFAYANPALDSAEVWRVDGTDHISICKPISKTSEVYQRCVTFIGACKEAPSPHRVSVAPLKRNVWRLPRPMNPEGFIGRKHYLDLLESCWRERRSQVFELIADGGIGKSTIVWRWIQDIVNFRSSVDKDCGIFAWSFYDQGRHEYFPNSDDFLLEAGQHFGLSPNPTNMIDHATRIAEVFAVRGGILILDGLEPLQYSPIKYDGALKDPALIAFFKQLFAQPSPHDNSALPNRMLVVTTRFRMGDPFGVGHERIDLSRLDEDEGIELLKRLTLGSQKLHVTPESQLSEQCRNLVRECEGHALSLVLIGTYLITRFRGDLRRRSDFEQILKDPSRSAQASHAHRVMDAYEQLFDSGDLPLKRCRAVLFQLSLFDRPTHALFLRLFCCEASGITVGEEMTHTQQREAITYLRLIKLIEPAAIPDDGAISTHPLVRLHFRAAFRATDPVGYRAAHLHVANYLLTNLDSEKAESFFERVFQAIVHACLAEHFSDAFEGIYKPYLCAKQSRRAQQEGMYAKLVTVLSYFVVGDEWGKTRLSAEPEQNLSEAAQLVIHMHAGANLTAAKGYAAEEVGQAYAGARQLACVLQDTRAELIALYGLWRYEIVGARMDSAAKLAREVEELGSRLEAWPTARYVVTRTTVTGMFYTGAFSKVVSTSADYLLDKDWLGADGAAKDLETEAVVTLTMYAAISSWYLGDVEDALLLSEQAEAMARRAGKTHTLAIALFFRGVVADFVEDFGVLSQVAGELGQLTATQDLVLWNAAGEFMGARAKCQTEPTPDYPNGYRQMVVALGRWVDTGAQLLTPFFYSRLAILAMNMGAFDKAESHIQAGLARSSSEGGEQWTRGELLRLRGVLESKKESACPNAEGWFKDAIEWADRHCAVSVKRAVIKSMIASCPKENLAEILTRQDVPFVPIRLPGLGKAMIAFRTQCEEGEVAMAPISSVDFVIVTALEEERDAVLSKLPGHRRVPPDARDVRVYYSCDLPTTFPDGSMSSYSLIVMPLLNMGRLEAANATGDAIRRWSPRNVLLVGIGGALTECGVKLGDILISDQVVDYELQKITPKGPEVRYSVHRVDPGLLGAVRNFTDKGWIYLVQEKRPVKGKPTRKVGCIATGDKVIAFAELLEKHRRDWPKLIGVEMEAGGVASACFQAVTKPGFFMIRCASDLADANKDSVTVSKWRSYACDVAAAYAVGLLQSGPIVSKASE